MFGSLVVVYPTPHEGGALVLRHEGQEWTFDAASLLSTPTSDSVSRIAYVAFFSDVEHEVLRVASGHRVTITYNLYWAPSPTTFTGLPSGLSVLYPTHSSPSELHTVLSALLQDPSFLPNGGTLGFALRHAYPFPRPWDPSKPDPLDGLETRLKGGDAVLLHACTALGLNPLLRLVYESWRYRKLLIMTDRMPDLGYTDTCSEYLLYGGWDGVRVVSKTFESERDNGAILEGENQDGDIVEEADDDADWVSDYSVKGDDDQSDPETGPKPPRTVDVHWVLKCERWNAVSSKYVAYGNEASTEYLYMSVALLVDVGPFGKRTDVSSVQGVCALKTKPRKKRNLNIYDDVDSSNEEDNENEEDEEDKKDEGDEEDSSNEEDEEDEDEDEE